MLPRPLAVLLYIDRGLYPSKQQILTHLANKDYEKLSNRSIERDLQRLRSDMGVVIRFDQHKKGYYLPPEDNELEHVQSLLRIGGYFHSNEVLQRALTQGTQNLDFIDLNHRGKLIGEDWMDLLYDAAAKRRNLLITYQSFDAIRPKSYLLSPWVLKYYQGRWYVAGETKNGFRIFGVDRIRDIEKAKGPFRKCPVPPTEIFRHQIGIYEAMRKPVKVVFKASPKHAQFLRTLPMHHSQQEVKTLPDQWVEFTLQVSLNFELTQNFLMAGERVVVLQPKKLIDNLKKEIDRMHSYYR